MTTIAGLFRTWDNAAHAIDLLSTAGFDSDHISLIVPEKVAREHRDTDRTDNLPAAGLGVQAAMGAQGTGVMGGLGNMMSGSTPLAVAGMGSVLFAGPLARGSRQAAAGTEVETGQRNPVRDLTNAGIPAERAGLYAEGVKRGHILVVVEAGDNSAAAISLMNQANSADVEALGREWQREGWQGFNSQGGAGRDNPAA